MLHQTTTPDPQYSVVVVVVVVEEKSIIEEGRSLEGKKGGEFGEVGILRPLRWLVGMVGFWLRCWVLGFWLQGMVKVQAIKMCNFCNYLPPFFFFFCI